MPPRTNKNSPRRLDADEKARHALSLRRAGLDFDAIAQQVGYANRSGAWKAVVRLVESRAAESVKDADVIIAMEVERLDAMLMAVWAKAKKGDVAAVDRVLKIQERRAKLLGLDAPTKTASELSGNVSVTSPVIMIPPESDE